MQRQFSKSDFFHREMQKRIRRGPLALHSRVSRKCSDHDYQYHPREDHLKDKNHITFWTSIHSGFMPSNTPLDHHALQPGSQIDLSTHAKTSGMTIIGSDIIIGLPLGYLIRNSYNTIYNGFHHLTKYKEGRFIQVTISIIPTGFGKRSCKQWTLAFHPGSIGQQRQFLDVKALSSKFAVVGSASSVLTLSYVVPDRQANLQFQRWDDIIGVIYIHLPDDCGSFPEVAPVLAVTGSVEFGPKHETATFFSAKLFYMQKSVDLKDGDLLKQDDLRKTRESKEFSSIYDSHEGEDVSRLST